MWGGVGKSVLKWNIVSITYDAVLCVPLISFYFLETNEQNANCDLVGTYLLLYLPKDRNTYVLHRTRPRTFICRFKPQEITKSYLNM